MGGGIEKKRTSLTEFRHQMRSGDLLAYLYLNCLSNGIISCSRCYFVQIQPRNLISRKFNSNGDCQYTDESWMGYYPTARDQRLCLTHHTFELICLYWFIFFSPYLHIVILTYATKTTTPHHHGTRSLRSVFPPFRVINVVTSSTFRRK